MKKPVVVVYKWNPKTNRFDIPVIFEKTLPDQGNKLAEPAWAMLDTAADVNKYAAGAKGGFGVEG